jgi:small subunit ribosomal protein S21
MNHNFSVKLKKDEPIDRALKILKSKMETDGVFDILKSKRSFETPNQKKKRKLKLNHKKAKIRKLRGE